MKKEECFGLIDRYILFGGGPLLILTAKILKNRGIQVIVVTSHRHAKEVRRIGLKSDTLLTHLEDAKVEYVVSHNIENDAKVLRAISDTTIGLSFGAAWIFKQSFIEKFNGKLLNLHGSQLPKNRGGGGFSWRIMQGNKESAALIHKIDESVDTGDIVFCKQYSYPQDCKIPLDYQKYSDEKYVELLNVFFDKVRDLQSFDVSVQDESQSSYWPRLSTDVHGFIDWNWSAKHLERFINAFDDPYTGASTFVEDNKVRLKECSLIYDGCEFHPFQTGIIYRKNSNGVFIAANSSSLFVAQVLNENGNDIKSALQVGDRFYTPSKYIETAMEYRAVYTPSGLKES